MPKGIPKNKDKVTDTKSFVKRAIQVHGDKFIYDKSFYTRANQKVTITCPLHGDFTQTPNNHLSGLCGCKSCVPKGARMGTEYWIDKFSRVHGDAYDYSKFEANGAFTKSIVICNKTGEEFLISPDGHGNGKKGCPCCRYEKSGSALVLSEEEANFRLRKKHGGRIQIKSGYKKFTEKCELFCEEHGSFHQSPAVSEITLYGCASCYNDVPKKGGFYNDSYISTDYERLSSDKNNIYVLDFMDGTYKIGIAKEVNSRKKMIEKEYKKSKIVYQKQSSTVSVFMLEEHLHEIFERFRYKTEVSFAGETEIFTLDKTHLDFIKNYSDHILGRLSCRIPHGKM